MEQTLPDYTLEDAQTLRPICGVDEVGRGPWAGPVVAAAAIWPDEARIHVPAGLTDSKKLTAKRREAMVDTLKTHCIWAIGEASVEEIDSLNILAATKLAMQRAVAGLSVPPAFALVDGNQPPVLPCPVQSVVKGDSRSLSIAAASVIAKVHRDKLMEQLHAEHPHYGWASNAGYGAKAHQDGLATHGVTPHHRKSFAPIRKILEAA